MGQYAAAGTSLNFEDDMFFVGTSPILDGGHVASVDDSDARGGGDLLAAASHDAAAVAASSSGGAADALLDSLSDVEEFDVPRSGGGGVVEESRVVAAPDGDNELDNPAASTYLG